MKILITGGAGYVGTALTEQLANLSDVESIIVYDNLTRENYNLFVGKASFPLSKIKFVMGDILDSRKIRKELKSIDLVYHLAARVSTPFSNIDPHFFEQTNHWGTAELTYAIEETSSVKKVIYLSSTSVYGSSDILVNESTIPNPKTFYSISKLRGEEHISRLAQKKDCVIVRCGNVYGFNSSMRFDSVVNKFMFDANFNNKISIHGSGKQFRSFISIQKTVETLAELRTNLIPSGIYNLTERNLQILDLVDAMKEVYPEMEFLFINQHLDMRNLTVDPATQLSKYIPLKALEFNRELEIFKSHFTF